MRQRLIHGWGAVEFNVIAVVLAYAAAYTLVCLTLASFVLKRKRV